MAESAASTELKMVTSIAVAGPATTIPPTQVGAAAVCPPAVSSEGEQKVLSHQLKPVGDALDAGAAATSTQQQNPSASAAEKPQFSVPQLVRPVEGALAPPAQLSHPTVNASVTDEHE